MPTGNASPIALDGKQRIGVQIAPNDPFWVQVNETVRQKLGDAFVPFEVIDRAWHLTDNQMDELSEEILAGEFDAFICMILPTRIMLRLLEHGLPVICLEDEIGLGHPLLSSVQGWFDAGRTIAQHLAQALDFEGAILCLTGNVTRTHNLDFNRQRLAGVNQVLAQYPRLRLEVQQSYWDYPAAYAQLCALMGSGQLSVPDAVLGLSDSMALAAMDSGQATGFLRAGTLIAGINGEPPALAQIYRGRFHATVDIRAEEFAGQAVVLALQAARGEALPQHFAFSTELVTAANVAQVSIAKLGAIANLPARLVGINRKTEEQRLKQYEISSSINRTMAVLKDRAELIHSITELLRTEYAYDRVYFYRVLSDRDAFLLVNPNDAPDWAKRIPMAVSTMLREVHRRQDALSVADVRYSGGRFPHDPAWRMTRSRVVLPVRFGEQCLGLLDLQSRLPKRHLRDELVGLQLLADQLGVALHNGELYEDAVQARAAAEKANQLKTRLLANVSHELRAPLNVILGYSQALLANPSLYAVEAPPDLLRDMGHVFHSGEHLIRLINDLLDVSRAEIGALELFPETVAPYSLLRDVFDAMRGADGKPAAVEWRFAVPAELPSIRADRVRLRQILINLLSNASKFTQAGHVSLSAEVVPPHLHIWVEDTGPGIGPERQRHLFEPFVTSSAVKQRAEGIGLGLNITRRLVMLHGGTLTLDSIPGVGSTFHVYLPLPTLGGAPASALKSGRQRVMLGVAPTHTPNPRILEICERQGMLYYPVGHVQDLEKMLAEVEAAAIAWDMSTHDPANWRMIERLRRDATLSRVPFLLYQHDTGDAPQPAMTKILTKPLPPQTLYDYLDALRPEQSTAPVLLVDDDAETRALYVRLLQRTFPDLEIIEAGDGRQAVAALKDVIPSLILLDLIMPEVDGFAVLDRVRADPRTRQVPVVVVSGKVLSLEDVQKLDFANVLFQAKELFTDAEVIACLTKVFGQPDALMPQPTSYMVKHALAFLFQNFERPLTRREIAQAVSTNPSNLSRIFHTEVGITLWEFLARLRIKAAKELLTAADSSLTVTDIALRVGYSDPAYFSRVFKQQTGASPASYRKDRRAG